MNFVEINDYAQLEEHIRGKANAYLLLYKGGSELSECALSNIGAFSGI